MNRFFLIIISVLISCNVLYSQNNRILSLGGMNLAIEDSDLTLNLYDFGKNPAWLTKDESSTWLKIIPAFNNNSGDYRRKYDFEEQQLYDLSFVGLKALGKSGTFLGYTSYSFDQRVNVNRSLKYNTYAGEAFFMTDTTAGNFRYNGPTVGFIYSLEVLPDLLLGISADYQILDGLKKIYSQAETMYRDVGFSTGLAYNISDNITTGVNFSLFDSQESIESKTPNVYEVEIFNYRGETYSVRDRGSSVKQKIRKKGISLSPQLHIQPYNNLELALNAEYSVHNTKVFIPRSGLIDYEDGYSDFEDLLVRFRTKYTPINNLIFGLSFNYSEFDSWSKNSNRDLLLWKWNVQQIALGVGTSYYFEKSGLLLGAEYQYGKDNADSSKYIDNKFNEISSGNHYFKTGAELKIMEKVLVRAGYNIGFEQYDIVTGGKDLVTNLLSVGSGIKFNKFDLDFTLYYSNKKCSSNLKRNFLGVTAEVRLFTF